MYTPTADAAALISFKEPIRIIEPGPDPSFIERYMRRFGVAALSLSENRPEAAIYFSWPIQPSWLIETEGRIRKSIAPSDQVVNDGHWLSEDVAKAAMGFLEATADLLPGEPFIYSSRKGDLVAEFKAGRGTLTSVVSPHFAVLFAVVDGESVEQVVSNGEDVREAVRKMANVLLTGAHGVDTFK